MILTIDDNLMYQEMICDFLDALGINTLCALDGHRGIDLFKMHRDEIDVICLDLQMPGLSGIETYRHLRTLDSAIPIIFCTANDITWVQQLCRHDIAVYFFEKSLGLKGFVTLLKAATPKKLGNSPIEAKFA